MNTFAAEAIAKYPQASRCLTKDRDALLAFHDFGSALAAISGRPMQSKASSLAAISSPCDQGILLVDHGTTRPWSSIADHVTASKTWRRLMMRATISCPTWSSKVWRFKDGMRSRNQDSRRRLITPSRGRPKSGSRASTPGTAQATSKLGDPSSAWPMKRTANGDGRGLAISWRRSTASFKISLSSDPESSPSGDGHSPPRSPGPWRRLAWSVKAAIDRRQR